MHQNLAIILWQFNYGKNSFIVLVPAAAARLTASPQQNTNRGTCLFRLRLLIFERSSSAQTERILIEKIGSSRKRPKG